MFHLSCWEEYGSFVCCWQSSAPSTSMTCFGCSMESVSSGGPTPEDFQRFVEQTKRQRQEQRKVARLVLESSTHGGSAFYNSDANANITSPPGGDKAGAGADNQQHRQQQEDGHISTSHQQGGSQQVKDSKSSQQQQRERDSDGINSQGSGLLKKFKGVMKSLKMAGSNKDVASSCSAGKHATRS